MKNERYYIQQVYSVIVGEIISPKDIVFRGFRILAMRRIQNAFKV
jgi:hypothetical protein